DRVIESGRSVIVLVPEISLTGQTVDLFCGYFGERVAVIHSALSEGEKIDAWKRIRAHQVDVVIGTRSAVFAPLDNLGMIVIDEEQEHTYKSDMNPKYHTRDAARYRAAACGALMLLASATPSLESFHRAATGAYTLVTLRERYGGAVLPEVKIADLRADTARGSLSPIGSVLAEELAENLRRGEQSILFVSRRGYNNFLSCQKCGEVVTCPNCSVSLTYHREADGDILKCHYCGHMQAVPELCPACKSEHMSRKGFGTQLAAETLHGMFPDARILRLDADAAAGKFSHEQILSEFRAHQADILIGTQMVTKGHNFPDVTLVGVLSADAALYLDDFRATERTFALLTQVIGRAGRADKPGRAVIQTYSPDNETITLAATQDFDRFYESAIRLRRQLQFPPFCEFVLFGIHGEDEPEVLAMTVEFDKKLREYLEGDFADVKTYLFGPFEAPVYKVNNVYRMRVIMKCQVTRRVRELVAQLLADFPKATPKAAISVDVNPASM
ncbi:MAG: primosomal protein N', partial [Clostridia bacterium]|nr:primosomal protein N' [Clostridia bacterium]